MSEIILSRAEQVTNIPRQLVSITNGEMARTIFIGSNWNYLRIGILCNISQSVNNILAPIDFHFGLNSGTSSLYGSTNGPAHFVGVSLSGSSDLIWGPNAFFGANNQSYSNNTNTLFKIEVITGSLRYIQNYTSLGTIYGLTGSATNPTGSWNRAPIMIDYQKSASTWTVACYIENDRTNAGGTDINSTTFYNQIQHLTPYWTNILSLSPITFPSSESVWGYLDTVDIYWNKSMGWEIDELAVYKFS